MKNDKIQTSGKDKFPREVEIDSLSKEDAKKEGFAQDANSKIYPPSRKQGIKGTNENSEHVDKAQKTSRADQVMQKRNESNDKNKTR